MIFGTEAKKPIFRILFLVCAVLTLPSCDETTSQGEKSEDPKTKVVGFEAVITGSYEGKVSGNGVLVLLPEAGFEKQGYFFLADGQGIRPYGVTFILPRGLAPGKHILESPSPFNIGTVPSVRVDRDMGDSTLYADKNTSGFVDLIAFPNDERKLSGSDVVGSFEFQTEDLKGQEITVKGKFSFKVK
jgi:hypothetical protein